MAPRSYNLGSRQTQIDEIRHRILDAARALLVESEHYTAFTVDAVARHADVARSTVYYQFGSKAGLIEALCDAIATAGGFGPDALAEAFAEPDPDEALHHLIGAFARFWSTDRALMRRLRALAALDADVGAVIAARDDRLRAALGVALKRVPHAAKAVETAFVLVRFETFDALAGADREPTDVVPLVVRLVEEGTAASFTARRRG